MSSIKEKMIKIWGIAIPVVIQGIVFQLQSLTDKAFLGNIDSMYISALGAAQFPYNTTLDTAVALMIGVVILTAQAFGAKENDKIRNTVMSTCFYSSILTAAIFCLWFFFTKQVLMLFQVNQTILPYCVSYIRICSVSVLLLGIDSTLQAMLQGMGKTRPIMVFALMKVVLNIVLSYVLIFGKIGLPALKIEGAAIGTMAANLIASIGLILYCFVIKRREFHLERGISSIGKIGYFIETLKIGVPTALEYFLWNASNLVLMTFLNSISYQASAVYTLTFGIEVIVYAVFQGTGKASMTLIGQEIGAGEYISATAYIRLCVVMNTVLVFACTLVFGIFSFPILSIFTKDVELISLAAPYLLFTGIIMFPKSINVIIGNGIRAYKDTKWMLYSQIFGSVFVITCSFFLVKGMRLGVKSIYITLMCDESLRAIINTCHYIKKYGRRIKRDDRGSNGSQSGEGTLACNEVSEIL